MADKKFMDALNKKFKEAPEEKKTTFYSFGGWKQSERKREFVEAGKEVAAKRGIPQYNPDIGCPLGQRVLMVHINQGLFAGINGRSCIS